MTGRLRGLTMLMLLVSIGAGRCVRAGGRYQHPIAVWNMDEPAGVITMTDAIDGHHRTLQNVQTGAPEFPDTGSRFNGSSTVALVPASSDFNSGNANVRFIVHVDFTTMPNAAVVDYDLLRGPTLWLVSGELWGRGA